MIPARRNGTFLSYPARKLAQARFFIFFAEKVFTRAQKANSSRLAAEWRVDMRFFGTGYTDPSYKHPIEIISVQHP